MRIVLFDRELHEALTVIDVPTTFIRAVEARERAPYICLHAPRFVDLASCWREVETLTMAEIRVVRISLEPVMRGRGREISPIFWYGYPDDPELALELRAAFLPGQLGEVQRREKDAFWRGAFAGAVLR